MKIELSRQQAEMILKALNDMTARGKPALQLLLETIVQIEDALTENDQHDSDL